MSEQREIEGGARTRHLKTARLVLRPWRFGDDAAADAIYGAPEVTRWLCPAVPAVRWISDRDAVGLPVGRWAIVEKKSKNLIGGVAFMPLPPDGADLEIGWQLKPAMWGHGCGAEAGQAVAHRAFENARISEVFAVVRPGNRRGVATARRIGYGVGG
jgi:RimJ/RimL family protein N-acetyltransferase